MRSSGLRIAMIGQRGVPATFGGVERHVEELGSRLVERGHHVTVYCRRNYVEGSLASWRGMNLRHLPSVDNKHIEAVTHSSISTAAAMMCRYDIIHYHAVGPALPSVFPRYASSAKVAVTVHGLDGDRAKWGRGASRVLKTAEWMSAWVPDVTIVVSRALAEHYSERYHRKPTWISNGVTPRVRRPANRIRDRFGLEKGSYLLFVGRLVPEKAPDLLIRAYQRLATDTRLVLVGGSSFTDEYVACLRAAANGDERILFTGYVYGELLEELYSNARAFVLPSLLEGLPLTLLEAAAYGLPVVASDIRPHEEVLRYSAPGRRMFAAGDVGDLTTALAEATAGEDSLPEAAALRDDVVKRYSWDVAARLTEAAYLRVLGQQSGSRPG